jgi:acid phosphatase
MKHATTLAAMLTAANFLCCGIAGAADAPAKPPGVIGQIDTIVVIYAENRSFDDLYGFFPGANGIANASQDSLIQRDRDGSVLKELPPIWGGLTGKGVTPVVNEAQTAHLPNKPFAINDPKGFNLPLSIATRDMWHLFYQNQMQIDGGKNDMFAAYADGGGLVMGHYTVGAADLPLWQVAQKYTLADNFFMGSFGGSFLNHFWLVCACTPTYPHADQSPAKDLIAAVDDSGTALKLADNSPKSALDGPPKFAHAGQITSDFYAINTMQPPYQPSSNKPPADGDPALADPAVATTLPPQTDKTIGDLLSEKGIDWAWYSGAWQMALDHDPDLKSVEFQYHHQVFNYFADMAPGADARKTHLRDGGRDGAVFIQAIDAGTLPPVSFYKPQGNLNEHPGYAAVLAGDQHIADVIAHLEKSPQWGHMLVVVTYDENGGIWDHVAPPKADRWGPGSRIPTLIVSPFAKRGFVDHTQYDTTSILDFITKRFGLPALPGLTARAAALKAHGSKPNGDLTAALTTTH